MRIFGFNIERQRPQQIDMKTTSPVNDAGYVDLPLFGGGSLPTYNPDFILNNKGYNVYRNMLRDEQVKAVYRFRRNATTGRAWRFQYTDEQIAEIGEQEAELRTNVFTEATNNITGSFKQAMDSVMTAMAFGYSMVNKVFELMEYDGRQWYGIKRMRRKPAFTFRFYHDQYGNLIRADQQVNGKTEEVDLDRFVHYVYNPDEDEHYGRSEMYECYRAWFSKDIIIRYHNIHMERAASGFNVLKYVGDGTPAAYGTPAYNSIITMLDSIRNGSNILLPKGYDIATTMPKTNQSYETAIAMYDKMIAKSFLVPNLLGLSEQGEHGGYSQSMTQLEAFLWMLDSDSKTLGECLDEQLFWELGDLNFGDGMYPCFHLLPLSQSQINEVVKTWGELVSSGAVEASDTDEEQIRDMLGMPDKGEVTKQPAPVVPPGQQPGQQPNDQPNQQPSDAQPGDAVDETILGDRAASIEYSKRFSAAVKRVDFAALDRNSDMIVLENKHLMVETVSDMIQYAAKDIEAKKLGTAEGDPADVNKFNFRSSDITAVKKIAKKILTRGWNLGKDHAEREVKIALKREAPKFSKLFVRLDEQAARYFDTQAFIMTGNLTDRARALIKQILMNGIRYSKSVDEIRDEIYRRFASEGMISKALAEQALGVALDVEDPTHRINTVIKTNTFEAINEARYSFFSDPDMTGHVVALEYSAVMDGRTTTICNYMDGHEHAVRSDVWESGWRPPNHYNCRSVLVPILQGDSWSESEYPTVQPQEGFA